MASSIEIDVSANIAKFKTAMDKAANEGSRLNKRLDKSFRSINKAMKGLGAIAGVAVGGGLSALSKQSIDSADNIEKLGRRTGSTAEFLSEMRLALSQSAVSQTEFETALRKINKSSQDASDGLSTQVRAFAKLGISVDEFQKLNTDQKFVALSEAISHVEDPAVRTQAAMDIMGRSGAQLITVMEGGAKGIADYRAEAVKLGQSLSQDQVEAAAAANDALDKLTKSISGGFSQTILNYTGEIKRAADFTREYFPRAIEFLIDIFRGLKATVQGVVLVILKNFEHLFKSAEKLPVVGEKFKGVSKFFHEASDVIKTQLTENVESMGKWRTSSIEASKESEKLAKTLSDSTVKALNLYTGKTGEAAKTTAQLKKEAKESSKVIEGLAKWAKEWRDNIPKTSTEEFTEALGEVRKETVNLSRSQFEFDKALKSGQLTKSEAIKLAQKLGVEYEGLSKETTNAVTIMKDQWERFRDSAFNSLQSFFKSGLSDTKSFTSSVKDLFKDMASGILAEITSLIASNAFKKLFGLLTGKGGGGGLLDGIGSIPGGGSKGGGALDIGKSLRSVAGIFGKNGVVGKLFASGGFFGSGGAVASAFEFLAAAAGPIGAVIAGIALASKLFGGGRSRQELGSDQLASVREAVSKGLTEVVNVGSGVTFEGGFNEDSVFFGADGLSKDQRDKVSKILESRFGFNEARFVEDGILRLEDRGRAFSENTSDIVNEVLASINEVRLGFSELERSTLKSLGKTVVGFDKAFDDLEGSGLSSANRLAAAYSSAFGTSIEEAHNWVNESGLAAERIAEIFTNSSGDVLSTMIGLSSNAEQQAKAIADSFKSNLEGLNGILNSVDLGTATGQISAPTINPQQTGTEQQTVDLTELIEQLKRNNEFNEQKEPIIQQAAAVLAGT